MNQSMTRYIQTQVMQQAKGLRYTVADTAPSNEVDLFNSPSLVVWSGASDSTIYGDAIVNWGFRAIHDTMHLSSGLGFSIGEEIELGRIQASRQNSSLMQELVYIEIAEQAMYYKENGIFVEDQVAFFNKMLGKVLKF